MKFVENWYLFESNNINTYSSKSFVLEICVSMVLLNNQFLDNILDKGMKARYSENSNVFLTDLKNLIISKNRLVLGKFENGRCIEDTHIPKINEISKSIKFNIDVDWNILIKSRTIARNIIDKILPDEKLGPDRIKKILWIGPNKSKTYNEDLVVELTNGDQYSLFLDKNPSSTKTSSFNTFIEEIIGEDLDRMFGEENIEKWDKLTKEWIRVTYENSNKITQGHIEKFIDPKRIDSIGYFEYFDIRHRDPRYKYLGEFIEIYNKNILKFSDLMNNIWKEKDSFVDFNKVFSEWVEIKNVILNSRILENLLTSSLKKNNSEEISKLENGMKNASGKVKMKFMKTIVNKLNCLERNTFFISKNSDEFYQIPSRGFFRKNYDQIDINFDYHVRFDRDPLIENSDKFIIKVKLITSKIDFLDLDIIIGFSGGEFSNKLSAKYKFNMPIDFNYRVSKLSI